MLQHDLDSQKYMYNALQWYYHDETRARSRVDQKFYDSCQEWKTWVQSFAREGFHGRLWTFALVRQFHSAKLKYTSVGR